MMKKMRKNPAISLDELRLKIDLIDDKLVRLLNKRAESAYMIGRKKAYAGIPVHDPKREKKVLQRVGKMNKGPLSAKAINGIYRKVISACLEVQDE